MKNLLNLYKAMLVLAFLLIGKFSSSAQNDVEYVTSSSQKIEQVVGDTDHQTGLSTSNLTDTKYNLPNTDLGIPFQHDGKTYVLFGDVWLTNEDAIGYTTDTIPEDGISMEFIKDTTTDDFRTVQIPGVDLGGFGTPVEGLSWNGNMYMYATNAHNTWSVLAKSVDDGYTFDSLYRMDTSKFTNLSVWKLKSNEFYPEPLDTDIQVMFGTGEYRESDVYLAYQRMDELETDSLHYFTGLDDTSRPEWSSDVEDGMALFDQPCVGLLNVVYNSHIKKWMMLYFCKSKVGPRGINCRTADRVWGPWSEPFVIFEPWDDNGYCEFIHVSYDSMNCDNTQAPNPTQREDTWGGEYGSFQYPTRSTGDDNQTTIYYNMSTWNPYTVVLMKSQLRKKHFADGTYRLRPKHSDKSLGNTGYPSQGTINVHQWTHSASADGQNWDLESVGDGYYKIMSSLSGLALTVESCGTSNGTNVLQATYDTLDCQHWLIEKVDSYYRIVSKETGKVLEIDGGDTSDGGNAELNTWGSHDYQQWSVYPYIASDTYRVIASHSGKALGNSNYPISGNKNVWQWTANDAVGQDWDFEMQNDGYYKITSVQSDSVLSVQGCSIAIGGNIRQESWTDSDCQKWLIEAVGDEFKFTSKVSGLVLMVEDGGGVNGENVEQDSSSNVPWKKWKLLVGSGSGSRVANETEVTEIDNSQLKIYPNPLTDKFILSFSSDMAKTSKIEIHDISGRKLLKKDLTVIKGANKIEVNAAVLKKGVYFLKIEGLTEIGIVTKKIIVE